MSLPNLDELHVNLSMINITRELSGLRKLCTYSSYLDSDEDTELYTERLVNAIKLTPNLSGISFDRLNILSEPAARRIKQIVHSREQKVVMYYSNYSDSDLVREKVGEVTREPALNGEFQILISPWKPSFYVKEFFEMIQRV